MSENITSPATAPVTTSPPQNAPVESGGAWARSIGDLYLGIARQARSPLMAAANSAEASKYFSIADRLDRALPSRDPAEQEQDS